MRVKQPCLKLQNSYNRQYANQGSLRITFKVTLVILARHLRSLQCLIN